MKITLAACLLLLALASADTFVQPLEFAYVDPELEDHLFFAETAPATTTPPAAAAPAPATAPAAGAPASPTEVARVGQFVTHKGAPGTSEPTTQQPRDYEAPAKVTSYDVGEAKSAPETIKNGETNVGREVQYDVTSPRVRTTMMHYITFKRTGELHTAHYDINDHTIDHVAPFKPGEKKITDMHHIHFQKQHSWEHRNVDIIDHEKDFVDTEAAQPPAEPVIVETGHSVHYELPPVDQVQYTNDVIHVAPPQPDQDGVIETGHVVYVPAAGQTVPKSKTTVQPVKFGETTPKLNLFNGEEAELGESESQWPYVFIALYFLIPPVVLLVVRCLKKSKKPEEDEVRLATNVHSERMQNEVKL